MLHLGLLRQKYIIILQAIFSFTQNSFICMEIHTYVYICTHIFHKILFILPMCGVCICVYIYIFFHCSNFNHSLTYKTNHNLSGVALSSLQLLVLVGCLQPEEQRRYSLCTFKKQFHRLKMPAISHKCCSNYFKSLIYQGKGSDLSMLCSNPLRKHHSLELHGCFFLFFFYTQDACHGLIVIIVFKKPSLNRNKRDSIYLKNTE